MNNKYHIPPKDQKIIANWLFCCAAVVFLMVVLGGLTRLTESGLSITEWQPVKGIMPPFHQADWNELFQKYQQSPQYKKINAGMTLPEFKQIFWLEYIHRLAGRVAGLIFFLPFIFFIIKKKLRDRNLILKLTAIFILGGSQGVIGWYMVKSGLNHQPFVSQYMLAFHLFAAFLIYSLLFILALSLSYQARAARFPWHIKCFSYFLTLLIFLQVVIGAFVAGTHAGLVYNTFPLMDGKLVPDDIFFKKPLLINFTENLATIQFSHRLVATILIAAIAIFFIHSARFKLETSAKLAISGFLTISLFQYCLGILTLIQQVPVIPAVLHQATAMILLSFSLFINYYFYSSGRKAGSLGEKIKNGLRKLFR